MNLSYRRWLLGAFLLPVLGCGGFEASQSYGNDAGMGGDASSDGTVTMSFNVLAPSATATTTLVPGEVLTVHVMVIDPLGAPVENQRLDFALIGQPMGSGLDSISATTNADGLASVFLRAGQLPATFQLRVSAGGTSSYLGISFVATVTVPLDVVVNPNVAAYVKNASVQAFAARTCDEVEGVPPSAEAVLNPTSGKLVFSGLSAGTSYAIVATATDAGGSARYSVCVVVDDPSITPSIETDFGVSSPNAAGTP